MSIEEVIERQSSRSRLPRGEMPILFDNGTPKGVARLLIGHSVEEARNRGRGELENGQLIDAAEKAGFGVFVTTDKNIQHQQTLRARKISLVVMWSAQRPMVRLVAAQVVSAVDSARPGSYLEVSVPFKD
jgi:hypothetical protein